LCGSYFGKGVAELQFGLLDDAVRPSRRAAGEDNLRIIPICLLGLAARLQGDHVGDWRRYVETINSSHRRGFLLGVSLTLVLQGGSGSPRRQARAVHDHGNGSSTAER
jgi:hypothetical protein